MDTPSDRDDSEDLLQTARKSGVAYGFLLATILWGALWLLIR